MVCVCVCVGGGGGALRLIFPYQTHEHVNIGHRENPDGMPHIATFYQGLHCLQISQ